MVGRRPFVDQLESSASYAIVGITKPCDVCILNAKSFCTRSWRGQCLCLRGIVGHEVLCQYPRVGPGLLRQQHRQAPQKDDAFVIANNAWLAKALYLAANVFGEKEWFSIADDVMHIIRKKIETLPDRVYLDDVVYALSAALAKEDNLTECDFYWHHLMVVLG